MIREYHAGNAKPGIVSPVPQPKKHISPMQKRLATTPMTDHKGGFMGVFKPVMVGGATGLGMMSTVSTLRSPVLATGGLSRPGYKRRGHCHKPKNPCFANPIPTKRQYAERGECRAIEQGVARFRKWHMVILFAKGKAGAKASAQYRYQRDAFLKAYPKATEQLERIENEQRRTVMGRAQKGVA